MKTEVDTTQYEFSHGHKPRGEGNWAFCTRQALRASYGTGDLPEGIIWIHGLYSKAKAQLPAGQFIALP